MPIKRKKNLRSQQWFNNPKDPEMTALYLERYLNYGLTRKELQSGNPIIGIAQSGSDLSPCNRHFLSLSKRIKDGIRRAGGIPMEFPTHPIQETGKRPTAMLDRNLSYLSLVEVLYGYPIDGVILTTGCDKTTPAALMAAATVNIPAIVLSGGNNIGDFTSRDKTEGALIRYASSEELPLLGICRGMQMIAHYHGASLVPLTGHVRKRHRLDGEVSWEVNSFHDFAIESCPTSFKVLQLAQRTAV